MDERPILPGLKNGGMTFDEFVEMKMKQNSDVNSNVPTSPGGISKKQFLKKGEGLSRWAGKSGNSPEAEPPATPPQSKCQNVRRKIFSATKESSGKPTVTSRVPSHVLAPKSPRPTGLASSQPKVMSKPAAQPNKRKNSPVPVSPRSMNSDFDVKFGLKSAPVPKSRSPSSFFPSSVSPLNDSLHFPSKPTDMTLCSEKEFEQMEEFLGDQPHDSSICSQASVVQKFMSRPSMRLSLRTENSPSSHAKPKLLPGNEPSQTIPNIMSSKPTEFKDDEVWGPELKQQNISLETNLLNEPSSNPVAPPISSVAETLKEQISQPSVNDQSVPANERNANSASSLPDPLQPLNDVLRTKILQLDVEIEKFRSENRRLEEKKRDFEKIQSDFISEKRKLEDRMESEEAKFEQFKRQELSKMKRERAALDQLRTQVHTLASEKNSVELVQLRERLRRNEQEFSEKEDRLNQALSRSKEQIKRLQSENEELKRSLEMLERLRIDRNLDSSKAQKGKSASDGSPLSTIKGAAPRKPLPLKGDARQNCIPPIATTSTVAVVPDSKQIRNEKLTSSTEFKHPSSQSDKEDDAASFAASDLAVISAFVPVAVEKNNAIAAAAAEPETASNVVTDKMDPKLAEVMMQWLKDLSFSPTEDEETCHVVLEKDFPDGKLEITRSDGSRRIVYPNGTMKYIGGSGLPVFVRFFNNDMKKVTTDNIVHYYYADSHTIQITYPDGLEVVEFSSGQVDKKYPNGIIDVVFPDGTVKQKYPDGVEVCTFPDGTVTTISANGDRVSELPNGQREIHTSDYKSRIYPNGIVRIIYNNDGICETRYPNGEVRRKVVRETSTKYDGSSVMPPNTASAPEVLPTTLNS